jgi:Ca2+-binding EF-hand superfamily protein
MNKMILASAVALLATSSLTLAHGQGQGKKGLLRFDRDGNGVVTLDEMRTGALERFDRMDANKDGRLTLDEIVAAETERAAKRFAEMDKNHDGKLERAEVPKMPDEVFARLDKDGNGSISREEMALAHGSGSDKAARERLQRADKNHDGAISRDEAKAEVEARFASLDTNHDGVLSAEELKAAHRGHGKRGHGEPKDQ